MLVGAIMQATLAPTNDAAMTLQVGYIISKQLFPCGWPLRLSPSLIPSIDPKHLSQVSIEGGSP